MIKSNKKAQGTTMLAIISAVAFFMFAIVFIGLLFPDIAITKDSSNLDCSNMTISNGNKLACLGVDSIVPTFIITVVLIAGGFITYKLIQGG